MISRTTKTFWKLYRGLPDEVRERAVRAYRQWRKNPAHPGLHFKKLSHGEPLWSVRISIHYRAIGLREDETVTWFWIGSHADYDKLLK